MVPIHKKVGLAAADSFFNWWCIESVQDDSVPIVDRPVAAVLSGGERGLLVECLCAAGLGKFLNCRGGDFSQSEKMVG